MRAGTVAAMKCYFLPTGDEIADGIVIDTNTPAMLQILLEHIPSATATRLAPVRDSEKAIAEALRQAEGADLFFLIGGSGGGHRFDPTLGKDFTHTALAAQLKSATSHAVFGKNGHLWTKLTAGFYGDCLVANVPGPYQEAVAATRAFFQEWDAAHLHGDLQENENDRAVLAERISKAMIQAVLAEYPTKEGLRCEKIPKN